MGLIISCQSGITYSNQAGGLACIHPEEDGVFVPLPEAKGRPEAYALQQRFRGEWRHINEEDALAIDNIFRRSGLNYVSVDRTRLQDSFEAWVYVLVEEPKEVPFTCLFEGLGKRSGVLVWQNSD
jgi:hypothetical protein